MCHSLPRLSLRVFLLFSPLYVHLLLLHCAFRLGVMEGIYSTIMHFVNLYYKERKQLKIFLTQFRLALPLTPDPPIRLYDDKKVEQP
jgi:hypothetical protein